MSNKAIVLLSGGQDSTTCLAWALTQFEHVEALSIKYGQRHSIELEMAQVIAKKANVEHTLIETDFFSAIQNFSNLLQKDSDINQSHNLNPNLPSSFVPGRNLYFLLVTGVMAYVKQIPNIVIGVSQADYSGYPDCRKDTIEAMERSLSLGLEYNIKIHTPLINLTKAETVKLMQSLGKLDWYAYTHTCYNGVRPKCGTCPACILREKGFKEAGIPDPLDQVLL